jgi:hypothetical protein
VLELLAVNRLCDPQSEWGVHQRWFGSTAMDLILDTEEAVAVLSGEDDRILKLAIADLSI